jgi:predicted RND superfamily exporter protein
MLIFFCYGLTQLKQSTSTYDAIDSTFKTFQVTSLLRDDFKDQNTLMIHIRPMADRQWQDTELCALRNWMFDSLENRFQVQIQWSPFHFRQAVIKTELNTSPIITFPNAIDFRCNSKNLNSSYQTQIEQLSLFHKKFFFGVDLNSILIVVKHQENSGRKLFAEIEKELTLFKINQKLDLQFHYMGEPMYEHYVHQGNSSFQIVNFVSVFFIFLIFLILFRSVLPLVQFVICFGSGAIFLHGFMGWMGHPLDLLSFGFFLMFLVATIEDFIYVIFESDRTRNVFIKLAYPSFLTSLTTALCFGVLATASLATIRRFGLYMALGSLLEWAILFYILPLCLNKFKFLRFNKIKYTPKYAKPSKNAFLYLQKLQLKKTFAYIFMPLIILGYFLLPSLKSESGPSSFFPEHHPLNQMRQQFIKYLGYDFELSLLIHEKLSLNEQNRIETEILQLKGVSRIEKFDHIYQDALHHIPLKYHSGLKMEIDQTTLSDRYFTEHNQERWIIHLTASDIPFVNQMMTSLSSICSEKCDPGGVLASYSELGGEVIRSLKRSVYFGAFFVFICIFVFCYSKNYSLYQSAVISLIGLAGPGVSLLLMFIFNQELNIATTLCFAASGGIAGDNIFQFLTKKNKESVFDSSEQKFGSALTVLLLTSLLSFSFIFSEFQAMSDLGLWITIGFIVGFFGDYYVLRAFLSQQDLSKTQIKGSSFPR